MKLSKMELQQIILSIYTVELKYAENIGIDNYLSNYDKTIDNIINEYSNYYEVTEHDKQMQRDRTIKLLDKLIEQCNEWD